MRSIIFIITITVIIYKYLVITFDDFGFSWFFFEIAVLLLTETFIHYFF